MIFILCESERYGEYVAREADLVRCGKNEYRTNDGEYVRIITNTESLRGMKSSKVLFTLDIIKSRDFDYYKDVVLASRHEIINKIEN